MDDIEVKTLLNQVDDYEETVLSSIAFCHLFRWNDMDKQIEPDSYFFFGRKMDTSKTNRIHPNTTVTPDFIIQLNDHYGIIGEVKMLPKDDTLWNDNFLQLQKYDDDLKGWKTKNEKIEKSVPIYPLTPYRDQRSNASWMQHPSP